MLGLGLIMTKSLSNYLTYMTNNYKCSIDAHFSDGAESVLLFVLPMAVARTLIVYHNDHITFLIPE